MELSKVSREELLAELKRRDQKRSAGGLAVKERYGVEYFRELGKLGGRACYKKYGPEFYEEIGYRGGMACLKKYGLEFYEEIGCKGGYVISGYAEIARYAASKGLTLGNRNLSGKGW